jgi:ketosteroid isomerase-like protein
VLGYYKHKKTTERLDIRIRFRLWVRDGLITRLEEYHDAPYVEAFERFVSFLQQNACEATNAIRV